jgi:hypothetical protein
MTKVILKVLKLNITKIIVVDILAHKIAVIKLTRNFNANTHSFSDAKVANLK